MRWIAMFFLLWGQKEARKASQAYEKGLAKMEIEDYAAALPYLEEAIGHAPSEGSYYVSAGYCAYRLRDNRKALAYYQRAYDLNTPFTPLNRSIYGELLMRATQPDKALKQFEAALSGLRPDQPLYATVNLQKKQAEKAIEMMKNAVPVKIESLGAAVNSKYPDFGPVISADEALLIFTSRRPGNKGGTASDGLPYEDLYFTEKTKDTWTPPKNMGPPLNTETHDATIALSADGQTLYLYKSDNGGDIFESKLKGKKWSPPRNMGKPINSKYWEPSVCVSADGNLLFFVSDRPGGMGGRDIYLCRKTPKGTWGPPINLGPPINTPYDEDGPYLHPDGITLFYSSNGPNSMGGFDIFRSQMQPDSSWSPPVNLGYPINTPGDDIYFVLSASGLHGYYASEREDSYGEKDIYLVDFSPHLSQKPQPPQPQEEKLQIEAATTPAPVFRPNLTLLKGIIYDEKTQQPLEAQIILIDNEKSDTLTILQSNAATGKYLISLPAGRNYGIVVTAPNYAIHSENFIVEKTQGYQEIEKNIGLKKYVAGTSIILRNIFFDFDKATLRPESQAELNRVYQILQDYPKMKIRIGGHTDAVGSDEYNQKLSEARAKAVVDYLISRGIRSDRLSYQGYGESRPIDTNDTPQGRQNNRRVEMEILSVE
ncbi:MAG: OmpA family protein [Bacteroidia bacterium]